MTDRQTHTIGAWKPSYLDETGLDQVHGNPGEQHQLWSHTTTPVLGIEAIMREVLAENSLLYGNGEPGDPSDDLDGQN
jgi:hypothetical protein